MVDIGILNLADAMLSGNWERNALRSRARRATGESGPWLNGIVRRAFAAFAEPPDPEQLVEHLIRDSEMEDNVPLVREFFWIAPRMRPIEAASEWAVPAITSPVALADWLGYTPTQSDSLAGFYRDTGTDRQHHYHYQWRERRGGRGPRLIEVPKPRLMAAQRRILDAIIANIPPHDAAHGFRPGRSVLTYATPHVGRTVVIRFDLRSFFPTITRPWVQGVFAAAGYPRPVARRLAGICTHRTPSSVRAKAEEGESRLLAVPHLPQGAPTSPALANLCARRLDVRLTDIAIAFRLNYTRYADDLAFSGDLSPDGVATLTRLVAQVAVEEGFSLRLTKTRLMRTSQRQRLAGVVVNRRPNVARDEFDRLKAILCNCVRRGPVGQNRNAHPDFRAHLRGRIAHVAQLNAARAAKLLRWWERIDWGTAT